MPESPSPFREGDELSASRLNEWAEAVSGVPLEVGDGLEAASGSRRLLAIRGARPIVAKLSGASSPYSWTSQANTGAGTFADNAISGTSNAYEVNGVSGLANKVVRLYPDGRGKWNFQYLNCCGGGGCTGIVTVIVTCGGTGVSGVTVSLTLGSTTVSGTTGGLGIVSLTLNAAGTWSGTATKSGYATKSFSVAFACADQFVGVTLPTNTTVSGAVTTVCGGGAGVPGATVTLTQSSTTIGTTTTDSSGNYSVVVPNDGTAITATATRTRMTTKATTSTPGCVSSATINVLSMVPSTDYYCDPCGGPIPIYKTLTVTLNGTSVTMNATATGGSQARWDGAATIPISAKFETSCSGGTAPFCNPATATASVSVKFNDTAGVFAASWKKCNNPPTCGNTAIDDAFAGANPSSVTDASVNSSCTTHTNFPFAATFSDVGFKMVDYDGNDIWTSASLSE